MTAPEIPPFRLILAGSISSGETLEIWLHVLDAARSLPAPLHVLFKPHPRQRDVFEEMRRCLNASESSGRVILELTTRIDDAWPLVLCGETNLAMELGRTRDGVAVFEPSHESRVGLLAPSDPQLRAQNARQLAALLRRPAAPHPVSGDGSLARLSRLALAMKVEILGAPGPIS